MKHLQTGECERMFIAPLFTTQFYPLWLFLLGLKISVCVTLQVLLVLRSSVRTLGHCAFVHYWVLPFVVMLRCRFSLAEGAQCERLAIVPLFTAGFYPLWSFLFGLKNSVGVTL